MKHDTLSIHGCLTAVHRGSPSGSCSYADVFAYDKVGRIKGVLAFFLDGKVLFAGVNGFYYPISDDYGIKVYYSLSRMHATDGKRCDEGFKAMKLAYEYGIGCAPCSISSILLNIKVGKVNVYCKVRGIISQRVHYPEDLMLEFAHGEYYRFDGLSNDQHPLHTPDEFVKFQSNARKKLRCCGLKCVGYKLGDIVYCTRQRRWFLVDCG